MAAITLYIHGQGITPAIAHAHCHWLAATTGHQLTPLLYHDLVDDDSVSLFGREVPSPLASAADFQLSAYLDDIARADGTNTDPRPTREIMRAHLYETQRSALRYLRHDQLSEDILRTLRTQIADLIATHAKPLDITFVAHSLGTVIALDLLQTMPPGCRVTSLITLGSPLGLIGNTPGRLGETALPLATRKVGIPWHDYAAEGDTLSTVQRLTTKRGFAGNPLTVSTILGTFVNPHECYFIEEHVAHAWTRSLPT